MDTVNYLEYLACNTHHKRKVEVAQQDFSRDIKLAFQSNNSTSLKKVLAGNKSQADMTRVFD